MGVGSPSVLMMKGTRDQRAKTFWGIGAPAAIPADTPGVGSYDLDTHAHARTGAAAAEAAAVALRRLEQAHPGRASALAGKPPPS